MTRVTRLWGFFAKFCVSLRLVGKRRTKEKNWIILMLTVRKMSLTISSLIIELGRWRKIMENSENSNYGNGKFFSEMLTTWNVSWDTWVLWWTHLVEIFLLSEQILSPTLDSTTWCVTMGNRLSSSMREIQIQSHKNLSRNSQILQTRIKVTDCAT